MSSKERICPTWLLVTLVSGIALVGLSFVEGVTKGYPLKAYIEHLLPHAILVASAILVGAILVMIVVEALEHNLVPLVREGTSDLAEHLQTAIKAPVDKVGETLKGGFAVIASSLAAEVQRFPEAWKSLNDSQVRADLIDRVKTPKARQLAEEGRFQDAIGALDKLVDDHSKVEEEIALSVLSADQKDWAHALDLIEQNAIRNPSFLITLAHRFWSVGGIDRAIALGKDALAMAIESRDETLISKAKNSLAYYLTETGDPAYEKTARQYAAEARQARPGSATVDTEGFVKITYGKSKEEVLEGVNLCERARRMGAPFEAYVKHITKAKERLEALENTQP